MPRGLAQKMLCGIALTALFATNIYAKTPPLPINTAAAAQIQKINSEVSALDKKIKKNALESLKVEYRVKQAAEGLAPAFTFYFEDKDDKSILRVGLVRVGHKTWSKYYYFYYDTEGKPIKYLEKISGREDKPAPLAIVYDAKLKVLWKNTERPRLNPKQVTTIFSQLTTKLNTFSGY